MTAATGARALAGRQEAALLADPSVRRMADCLAARCRGLVWARTAVASLNRFRALTGHDDLEALLARARAEPAVAEQALAAFARTLAGYGEPQVATLALGPKLWFRLNGVMAPWRPLPGTSLPPPLPLALDEQGAGDRLVLLALLGSGLYLAELLRLRLGDLGSLGADGQLLPDAQAEPLAVRFWPRRGSGGPRLTFFSYQARQVLLADLARRGAAGQPLGPDAPLIARPDGSPATPATVAQARRRNAALIRAGNDVNVALCRATGDFFRVWGLPGSRFVEVPPAADSARPRIPQPDAL